MFTRETAGQPRRNALIAQGQGDHGIGPGRRNGLAAVLVKEHA